jgi:DNA anti-recombination protein RmuC
MVVVHEFCKEEAVMADTRRMEEQASRIGEEVRETTQRMGREYQKAVERGFETASKTFSEANRGFQALAAEMTDFSKRRWEDVFHAWEQLLRARHSETWSKSRRSTLKGRMTPTPPRCPNSEKCV